jgi:hypothetical protein
MVFWVENDIFLWTCLFWTTSSKNYVNFFQSRSLAESRLRNPAGNPCIKIIISTAHGTLAWSVSCKYNNPIISVNALLSREWYVSVYLFILDKFKKTMFIFLITISRGTPVEKPYSRRRFPNLLSCPDLGLVVSVLITINLICMGLNKLTHLIVSDE